jgi:hypothetical protein
MNENVLVSACLAAFFAVFACGQHEPDELIVGSWVIDEAAQREEVGKVSPSELEDFDEAFRRNLLPVRETFHEDGRYEILNTLGGPFDDHWEVVSAEGNAVTIRSSGHSWISRAADIGGGTSVRSPSLLTYTFSDEDHMYVTVTMPVFGEEKTVSFFFVRDE